MLDFVGGYGTLSKYFGLKLLIFDPYIKDCNIDYISKEDYETKKYKVVFNSAMFEYIRNRNDLEQLNQLVDNNGILIIHTVVCERIPKDSNWFYLRPLVHCAFHTNHSMEILMDQWSYTASIYCPQAKSWVLLKKKVDNIQKKNS
ncbi:MAG: methyltransferase domain-containing protein [Candidatus Azobacteroides sp.]|nr:methyltransferase domain-containing protein [Candidatus Azobacteroides sp.]